MATHSHTHPNFPAVVFQSCAVTFIEKLDAAALNLSPEEFQHFMQGPQQHLQNHGAEPAPPASGSSEAYGQPAAAHHSGSQRRRGQEVRARLEELKGRQERIQQGALSLQEQLQSWVRDIHLQLDHMNTAQSDDLTATEVRADDDDDDDDDGDDDVTGSREVLVLQEEVVPEDACKKETEC